MSSTKTAHLTISINEELPPGTVIGNIRDEVIRQERMQENVCRSEYGAIWNLYEFDPQYVGLFKLENKSANLLINKQIDREVLCPKTLGASVCKLEFAAVCQSQKNKIDETWYPLAIVIKDIDDNWPIFTIHPETSTQLRLRESEPLGFKLHLPTAVDADQLRNSLTHYRLSDNPQTEQLKEYFDLQVVKTSNEADEVGFDIQSVPVLVVKKELDYETQRNFNFKLFACNSKATVSINCSSIDVAVLLIDVNDNSPIIVDPPDNHYELKVSEALPVGAVLLKVHATDIDSGEAGRVSYSLKDNKILPQIKPEIRPPVTGTDMKDTFLTINDISGELHLIRSLTLYDRDKLESTVLAIDNGEPRLTSSVHLSINIIDTNNHAPEIEVQQIGCNKNLTNTNMISLSTSTLVGSHVALILVSDQDHGNNGEVLCHTEHLNDHLNDRDPRFPLIRMGTVAGRYLHALQIAYGSESVQQKSSTEKHDYSIYEKSLSPIGNLLKFESQPVHIPVMIVCSDLGAPNQLTSSVTVLIRLVDETMSQICFEHRRYHVNLEETSSTLLNILTPQLQQLVLVNSFHFLGDKSNDKACQQILVDQSTGELSAPRGIDREIAEQFKCTLSAVIDTSSSTQPVTAETDVHFHISDINDNVPSVYPDILVNGFSLLEWDGMSSSYTHQLTYPYRIGTVLTDDPDAEENGTVTFILHHTTVGWINSVDRETTDKSPLELPQFQIDYRSGEVSLSKEDHKLIDRESVRFYNLHLILYDGGQIVRQSNQQNIQIHVTDLNDNRPVWKVPFTMEFSSEGIWLEVTWTKSRFRPGEYLCQVVAEDSDQEGTAQVSYRRLSADQIPKSLFSQDRRLGPTSALSVQSDGLLKLYETHLYQGIQYVFGVQAYDVVSSKQLMATGLIRVKLPLVNVVMTSPTATSTPVSVKAMRVEAPLESSNSKLSSARLRLLLTILSTCGILIFIVCVGIAMVFLGVKLRHRAVVRKQATTTIIKQHVIPPSGFSPAYPEIAMPMTCSSVFPEEWNPTDIYPTLLQPTNSMLSYPNSYNSFHFDPCPSSA